MEKIIEDLMKKIISIDFKPEIQFTKTTYCNWGQPSHHIQLKWNTQGMLTGDNAEKNRHALWDLEEILDSLVAAVRCETHHDYLSMSLLTKDNMRYKPVQQGSKTAELEGNIEFDLCDDFEENPESPTAQCFKKLKKKLMNI